MRVFILRKGVVWTSIIKGLAVHVRSLSKEQDWQIKVDVYKKNKTAGQQGFFHVLCGILGNELGYTMLEIKEMVKAETLGTMTIIIGDMEHEIIPSTTTLNREKYSMLIEAIYRIASVAGVILPLPDRRFIDE